MAKEIEEKETAKKREKEINQPQESRLDKLVREAWEKYHASHQKTKKAR